MARRRKIERPPETALVPDPETGQAAARLDSLDAWRQFDFSTVNRLQRITGCRQSREQEARVAGLPPKKAKGVALRATAKEFGISQRAVQLAERKLRETIEAMMSWSSREQARAIRELIHMHASIREACGLLQMPPPGPLSERALGADSPEKLAAAFAEALVREHEARISAEKHAEVAEEELKRLRVQEAANAAAPGYSPKKRLSAKH